MSAADAYGQARIVDDLVVRVPPGSPELHRRIAEARAAFFALASSGPDLPSMQAASMVSSALEELDAALKTESSPIGRERDRLNAALALLLPRLGTVASGGWDRDPATSPPPIKDPRLPR